MTDNVKMPIAPLSSYKALGQIYNVLIILAITLLMAVTTTVLAYFVDLLPDVAGNVTPTASNVFISSTEAAQDN
jgi:hypothetical protein